LDMGPLPSFHPAWLPHYDLPPMLPSEAEKGKRVLSGREGRCCVEKKMPGALAAAALWQRMQG